MMQKNNKTNKKFNRTGCEETREKLRALVRQELEVEQEILGLMRVVYQNRWHLELGYRSIHDFLVRDSGMASGTANRRIHALKLIDEVPETAELMREGKISLSNAAEIHQAFENERKLERKKNLENDNTLEAINQKFQEKLHVVLAQAQGTSYRECQKILARELPQQAEQKLHRAQEMPTPDGRTQLVLYITPEFQAKLDELKGLLSHLDPNPSLERLLELAADQLLNRIRKQKPVDLASVNSKANNDRATKTPTSGKCESVTVGKARKLTYQQEMTAISRASTPSSSEPTSGPSQKEQNPYSLHIPRETARAVWVKAQGRCEFTDPYTGRRCNSTHQLEIDHQRPRALGGTNEVDNLGLLCRAHNQLRAWKESLIA